MEKLKKRAPKYGDIHPITSVSPHYMQRLLAQGAVLIGPGSETRDIYFYQSGDRYVFLSEAQGVGKTMRHTFPATAQGLIEMIFHATFHNSWWCERP